MPSQFVRVRSSEGEMAEHQTIDTRMVFRGMLVGLDDPSIAICKGAMRPLTAILVAETKEACRRMSEVLPLIVILADDTPKTEISEVADVAQACGAEVMIIARPPDSAALGKQILDALRKGEARRVGRP